jgi:hypothetical protein
MIRNSRNDIDLDEDDEEAKVLKNEAFLETISEIKDVRLKTANK